MPRPGSMANWMQIRPFSQKIEENNRMNYPIALIGTVKHGGKNCECEFSLPQQSASGRPRKYFSFPAQFRQYTWGSNQPILPVALELDSLFSGRGGRPLPVVCDVSKVCLAQAERLAGAKKPRKPPIGGLCTLTRRPDSGMNCLLNEQKTPIQRPPNGNRLGKPGAFGKNPLSHNPMENNLNGKTKFTAM